MLRREEGGEEHAEEDEGRWEENGWRLLSGHINVNFHPGSPRTYLQSKFLATKTAASRVVAEEAKEEDDEGGERGREEQYACCSMLFSGIINVTRHVNAR